MTVMQHYVDVMFDCLPLRSVGRFDPPIDAAADVVEFHDRLRRAAAKHGLHNSYYLYRATCIFHLTNDAEAGMVEFAFEGTVLTDTDDLKTRQCDLEVRLQREVCDWLTAPAVQWLGRVRLAGGASGIRPLHRRRRFAEDDCPHGAAAKGDRGPRRLSGNGL